MTDDTTVPAPQTAVERDGYSVASQSASIAGWTVVSRITGFARAVVIAAVLGPTFFGNLFQALNTFPNLVYELVLGSLIASLLVPPLVAAIDDGDEDRAGRIADGVLGLTTILFVAAVVVVMAASPILLHALAVGIDDPAIRSEQRRIGLLLLAVLLPQTALYGLAATGAAVQNARGRFALAAAAPVGENVIVMGAFLVCAWRFQTGAELGAVAPELALVLAAGSTTAVAIHAAIQWYGAKRVGHTLVPRAGWRDPDVRALFGLALPSFGYASVSALRVLVLLITAGTVKGGVVALQFAYNFYYLPGALLARPLSVASLPMLSRLARSRGEQAFQDVYRATLRVAQLLTIPAVVTLAVLAVPISRVVSHGAMASTEGRALLAVVLASLSIGMIGDAGCIISTAASYARTDAVGPFVAMATRATLVCAAALASLAFGGHHRLLVLALGASSADLVAAAVLDRRAGSFGHKVRPGYGTFTRILVSGLVAAGTGVLMQQVLDTHSSGQVADAIILAAEIAVVVLVYAGVAVALGVLRADTFRALRAGNTHVSGRASNALVSRANQFERPRAALRQSGSVPVVPVVVCALLLAAAAGVATPRLDGVVLAVALGIIFATAIYLRPSVGAYVMLGLGPLIVGIDRGSVIPLLRLNEAILIVVVGVVLARAIITPSGRAHLTSADASMVLLAMCGALLPLAVSFYRTGSVTRDDLLFAAPLVKLVLVYSVFRVVIKSVAELRRAMMIAISSAAAVSMIGIAQVVNVFGVRSILTSGLFYTSGDIQAVSGGRGTSTIGSSIGAAGFYVLALMVALAWGQHPAAPARALRLLTLILLLGLASTAQFSALFALLIGLFAVQRINVSRFGRVVVPGRRRAGVAFSALLMIGTGWVAFAPRLSSLARGQLPRSWAVRWDNLATHFLPSLHLPTNLLWGVTPVSVVSDPRGFVPAIWIESGYVWLVWTGGVFLAIAFLVMVITQLRGALIASRRLDDEFGVIATAAVASLAILCGLMVLDAHLTLRGTSDLLFPILGLAATAGTGSRILSGPSTASGDRRLDVAVMS